MLSLGAVDMHELWRRKQGMENIFVVLRTCMTVFHIHVFMALEEVGPRDTTRTLWIEPYG